MMGAERPQSALAKLLSAPTTERKPRDYELVFDDFVSYAGGWRVTDVVRVPPGVMNADYHFETENYEVLLELKQVSGYDPENTMASYLAKLQERGGLSLTSDKFELGTAQAELDEFYKVFRPSIAEHLRKASRQLKATDRLLPKGQNPRFCGVLLVNSGDYSLPLDLMYHLVERRAKLMWKRGQFSKLDFVSCLAVDLIRRGQHPLQGHHIARSLKDPLLVEAARHIYHQWLCYFAAAIGMKVEFSPGDKGPDLPLDFTGQFDGKIRLQGGR